MYDVDFSGSLVSILRVGKILFFIEYCTKRQSLIDRNTGLFQHEVSFVRIDTKQNLVAEFCTSI